MHRATLPGLILTAAALFLAGCDAGDAPRDGGQAGTGDAASEFAPVNRSGVTGSVRADHGGEETTVTVEVAGLPGAGEFPVHIHTGRCAAGGPVAVPLGRVRASEDGTGRLTSRVAGSELGPDAPAFIQVHDGEGAALACADLGGHDTGEQPLTERLDSAETSSAPEDGA